MSFDGFIKLNAFLAGFYRVMFLNLLWFATTVGGLGLLGVGPATYAVAKYLDRWFRLGETPKVAPTFLGYLREQRWRPVLVSWLLIAVALVVAVNLMSISNWYLRVLNALVLAIVAIVACYVYFVMAALDIPTIRGQIASAFLIGIGSLHWSIIGTVTTVAVNYVLFRFATPLLVLFGIGIPMAITAFIVRGVFRELDDSPAGPKSRDDSNDAVHPPRPPLTADRAPQLVKGITS